MRIEIARVLFVYSVLCVVFAANVQKWAKAVADDEKDLEKMKKDEQKQMRVKSLLYSTDSTGTCSPQKWNSDYIHITYQTPPY